MKLLNKKSKSINPHVSFYSSCVCARPGPRDKAITSLDADSRWSHCTGVQCSGSLAKVGCQAFSCQGKPHKEAFILGVYI